ncbi:MAG: DUF4837 family protein [Bacteroidota bacterium]
MIRPLALAVLTASAALLSGCGDQPLVGLPSATGGIPEVLVVSDSTTWNGAVGDAVREVLAQPIATLPNKQGFLRLRFQQLEPNLLSGIRKTRNVIFVAPLGRQTAIGDYLRARIPEGQQQALQSGNSVAVTIRENLWAAGQVAVTATAATDSLLADAIRDRADSLRAVYNRNVLRWTQENMYDRARQTDIEAALMAEKGWAVNLQHDYIEVQDTTVSAAGRTGQFTRFRRIVPETWRDFFVFSQDGVTEIPSETELDVITNDLLETFARGEIDSSYVQLDPRRPVTSDTLAIGGRTAVEKRGLWRMINFPMGGSYIRFSLVDEATDRLYVYYGMVYSPVPRYDKREFMRQLEITGRTFRTAADEARTEA